MTQNIKDVILPMQLVLGSAQVQDIQDDVSVSIQVIANAMQQADNKGIDILCFPECFLQGYTLDTAETKKRALSLNSVRFKKILDTLAKYKVTIILGLIEKDGDCFYNTAALVRGGKLLGTYRKVHLFEHNFQPGDSYPVFETHNTTFGINICYDARFSEGSTELAANGAKVIFYPLSNRWPHEKAANYRDKHILNLIARAKESGCWVVSSDITAQDETHTGYGCTAIVSPQGEVISRVQELKTGMISAKIS